MRRLRMLNLWLGLRGKCFLFVCNRCKHVGLTLAVATDISNGLLSVRSRFSAFGLFDFYA